MGTSQAEGLDLGLIDSDRNAIDQEAKYGLRPRGNLGMLAKPSRWRLAWGAVFLAWLPGCQFLHVYRPVSVLVRDAETKQPISNAQVSVSYLAKFNPFVPWRWSATTGHDGNAVLLAAPYRRCAAIEVRATARGYFLEYSWVPADLIQAIPPGAIFSRKSVTPDLVLELYAEPTATVDLILPDGFRGPVKMRFEPQEGQHPPGQRTFRYAVSPSGSVTIDGPRLLKNSLSRNIQARYENEPALPTHGKADVAFRWITCTNDTQLFVVGSVEDEEALYRRVHRQIGENTWQSNHESYERLFAE